jgi:hypothetical protein
MLKEYNRKELSKFCVRCGKELISKEYFSHFNRLSGEKVFYTVLFCPNNLFRKNFWSHWVASFDENGEEVINWN